MQVGGGLERELPIFVKRAHPVLRLAFKLS
jgi:hypothetical protein